MIAQATITNVVTRSNVLRIHVRLRKFDQK